MSLHEKMLCECGHPRYAHAQRSVKRGLSVEAHCRRCDCALFAEANRGSVTKITQGALDSVRRIL